VASGNSIRGAAVLADLSAYETVLMVAAAALPLLGLYAPRLLMYPAAVLALTLIWASWREGRPLLPRPPWALAALMAGLLVLGGIGLAWSADVARSGRTLRDLAAFAAGAFLLLAALGPVEGRARRRIGMALAAGFALAVVPLVVDRLIGEPLVQWLRDRSPPGREQVLGLYNRGLAVMGLFLWPAAAALLRAGRARLAVGLIAVWLAVAWSFAGLSMALAVTLGTVAAGLILALPRHWAVLFPAAAALWIAIAPPVLFHATRAVDVDEVARVTRSVSVSHRVVIWRFVTGKIAERPFTGHGIGASRSVPGGGEKIRIAGPRRDFEVIALPHHPHNAVLEWWLDLGLPGAALAGAIAVLAFRGAARFADPRIRAMATGQAVTGFCIAGLSFGTWQAWWLTALLLAAVLTLAVAREPAAPDPPAAAVGG